MERIKSLSVLLLTLLSLVAVKVGLAADKLRFAVASKASPHLVLPVLAAEEKGLWKENGLEVEWYGFSGSVPMTQAIVSRSVDMGFEAAAGTIQSASRGIPMVNVADLAKVDYYVWVRADSPIKAPRDLKGAKIAVKFGSMPHAYALFLAKSLGLEKDIKLVSVGSSEAEMAAIKAGKIEGRLGSLQVMAPLKLMGEFREAVSISEHFPKEWIENTVAAPRGFLDKQPDVVKRAVKTVRQSVNYISRERRWSMERMKVEFGYSTEAAEAIYNSFRFSPDGQITRKAVENLRNFLIEYGLVPKEKTPPVEELYTMRFLD